MRLIDADALKNAIRAESWKEDITVKLAVEYINILIDEQPTINPNDLRPRGRWITERCNHVQHRFKNPEKWVIHKCSLCGYSNGRKQSNYCPNCGAKMDAEDINVPTKTDGKENEDA